MGEKNELFLKSAPKCYQEMLMCSWMRAKPNIHINSYLMYLASTRDAKIYGRESDEVMVRTASMPLQ